MFPYQSRKGELYGNNPQAHAEKLLAPTAPDTWRQMHSFFDTFENNHLEDMIEEQIEVLPDRELVQGWTVPLIDHAKSAKARGKELVLELLEMLEAQIQKRRAELTT